MTDEILTVTAADAPGAVTVLTAAGEIDHDSRYVLRTAAEDAARRGCQHLVIDLGQVTLCDSGGLGLFVQLHRQFAGRGGSVRLACTRGRVLAALTITNLDRLLPLHDTVDEAIRAVRG